MKEYVINYISHNGVKMVGSGMGENEIEAVEDFKVFHDDVQQIVNVCFYKNHNKMFKA